MGSAARNALRSRSRYGVITRAERASIPNGSNATERAVLFCTRNNPHGCGASTCRRHSSATRLRAASNENRRNAAGCSTARSASSLLCACRWSVASSSQRPFASSAHFSRDRLQPGAGKDVASETVVDHVGAPPQVVDQRHHLRVAIRAETGHHVFPPLDGHTPRVERDRDVRNACRCRNLRCDDRVVVACRRVMMNGDRFMRSAPGAHQLEEDETRVAPAAQRYR